MGNFSYPIHPVIYLRKASCLLLGKIRQRELLKEGHLLLCCPNIFFVNFHMTSVLLAAELTRIQCRYPEKELYVATVAVATELNLAQGCELASYPGNTHPFRSVAEATPPVSYPKTKRLS